jgi:TonB-dependent receptor
MKSILFLVSMLASMAMFAQGIVRGKVTDGQTGEELIGASVIIEGTVKGTASDLDGNYSLEKLTAGSYNLVCSFITYKSQVVKDIIVKDGEIVVLDFSLQGEAIEIGGEVIVEAKADKSRPNHMLLMEQKSAPMISGISSQQMKKAGDSDAVGALKRVTGVSTVGNQVFIRGLSDRYSKTTVNGAEIPSVDPYRNSVQMDLFPTNLLDNIVVYKTFTPNLPGDFTGGLVDISSKDFPEKLTFNYTTSLGYNTNATFNNNFLTSEGSDTDWLGYDNGTRDIPTGVIDNVSPIQLSNYYEALVYGGFESELNAIGIDDPTDIGTGANQTSIFNIIEQLEGVENIDQVNALLYEVGETKNEALTTLTQSFPKTWDVERKQGAMNMSHAISFGNQTKLFKRALGYNFGFNYSRDNQFYENGITGRYAQSGSTSTVDQLNVQQFFNDSRSEENAQWSALFNVSYKISNNNKISLMYMPIKNGVNSSRFQTGINPSDDVNLGQEQRTQRYLERSMNVYQMKGDHLLAGIGNVKMNWTASYTKGKQDTPDLRVFYNSFVEQEYTNYLDVDGNDISALAIDAINNAIEEGYITSAQDPNMQNVLASEYEIFIDDIQTGVDTVYDIRSNLYPDPTRFYREMVESTLDLKVNFDIPFVNETGLQNTVSFGASYVDRNRKLDENRYSFTQQGNIDFDGDPDSYFTDANMVVNPYETQTGGGYIYLRDDTELQNSYEANQTVFGAYGMVDWNLSKKLRMITGARVETTEMLLESRKLEDPNLTEELKNEFRGSLDLVDVLPSLNLSYQLRKKDLSVTNLRFAATRTLARPSFREKAPFATFDFESQYVWIGEPELERVLIDNLDLKFEHYPYPGEVFSAGLFYKRFTNPIEQVINPTAPNIEITWTNVGEASVYGAEFEVRKSLRFISPKLEMLSTGINYTYVVSKTQIDPSELEQIRADDPEHPSTRPMFGQAPYIVNGYLSYDNDSLGLEASINYNVSGEKLVLVTKGGTPDVYDQPRGQLDFSINKSIRERFVVGFKARNILDPEWKQTYEFKGEEYIWQSFNRGRTFSISLSYKI